MSQNDYMKEFARMMALAEQKEWFPTESAITKYLELRCWPETMRGLAIEELKELRTETVDF
jgi:hypothetical protein